MKAGFCCADITCALGSERPGDYMKVRHTALHDPLKVRAAVFDDDTTTIVVVGLDTCILPAHIAQRMSAGIEAAIGVPADRVLLAASHTHSGGPLWEFDPALLADAEPLLQRLATEFSVEGDPLYIDWVVSQTVSAVAEAYRRREPARLAAGVGHEDQVAHNRRFHMANGMSATHPGKGNPDILAPAGPTDPQVGVVSAWSLEGRLLGCLVNYTCHCTVGPGGISADWVCYLEQTVRAVHPDAEVVFLQGASGDVTQVDNRHPRPSEFGEAWTRRVGTRVGGEVIKVLAAAEPEACWSLAAECIDLSLARRVPDAGKVGAARALVEEGLATGQRDHRFTFAKERLLAAHLQRVSPTLPVRVQGLRLGDAVLVANPAELFCALGLAIKAASPCPLTFVVELANGCVGYVPGDAPFAADGGGYETLLTSYSTLAVDAGRRIVEASAEMARRLAPEPKPTPTARGAAGVWSYGGMGPEWD